MNDTVTIRLPAELAVWLKEKAAITGRTKAKIVREQLEKARLDRSEQPWMKLAGTSKGPRDLSMRKGYSRK